MELMSIVILAFILISGTSGAPNRKSSSKLNPSDLQELQHVRQDHGEALLDLAKGLENFVLSRDELEMEPSPRQYASLDTNHQQEQNQLTNVDREAQHEAEDDLNLHHLNEMLKERDYSQDELSRQYEEDFHESY